MIARATSNEYHKWRSEGSDCVGNCGKIPMYGGRTCGSRECLAAALYLSGLLPEPTVNSLNDWYRKSLIKQITEYGTSNAASQRVVAKRLVRQYALLPK